MTYLIRTRYQSTYASTEEQANDLAHRYLVGMIRNGLPHTHIWAKVINVTTDEVKTITPMLPITHTWHDDYTGLDITFYHTQFMNI